MCLCLLSQIICISNYATTPSKPVVVGLSLWINGIAYRPLVSKRMKLNYKHSVVPYSNSSEFPSSIIERLNHVGYVVVKDFPLIEGKINQTKEIFQDFCKKIGAPKGHDAKNNIIWDIKSKPPSIGNDSKVVTFSEHNHEADLHTDSQYSEYPEDYFALLTLNKAKCGGGESLILLLSDIIAELKASSLGKKILDILSNSNYPFIIPSVFKKKDNDEAEFNYGKIISGNHIRFRVDTVLKAINQLPHYCSQEQINAFNIFTDLIRSTNKTRRFYLEQGDCVFINNKTTLHGRSSFEDYERHLLRIRMNAYLK